MLLDNLTPQQSQIPSTQSQVNIQEPEIYQTYTIPNQLNLQDDTFQILKINYKQPQKTNITLT